MTKRFARIRIACVTIASRRPISPMRRASRCLGALLLTGCGAPLEVFSTASDAAERVSTLAWFMIILSGVIFVGVVAAMLVAMVRNRGRDPHPVDLSDRGAGWIIWGGAVMPTIVLVVVFVFSLGAMARFTTPKPAVTIHVTGRQWWWQLDYQFPEQSDHFRTANEIHIPAGRPVRLILTSGDVIHSFWVPQLQGKLDLIPGDTNDLRLVARHAGTYSGACAEFCGMQHAHMGITVIAEDSATFAQWAARQLTDGVTPADSVTMLGQRLFATGTCSLCHTVRGTPALAQVAPDLTHVGSRLTIAAGTLPNTLGNLEGWIANAQSLKPGTKMPTSVAFSGAELRAVATYVASLK